MASLVMLSLLATLPSLALTFAVSDGLPDPRAMMWPIPGNYSFQEGTISLVDKEFEIVGDGPGKASPLLKNAFVRYKQYFFNQGEGSSTSGIKKLTVYAGDASEVQTLDTLEECMYSRVQEMYRVFNLFRPSTYYVCDVLIDSIPYCAQV